jgi:hypothetical protein
MKTFQRPKKFELAPQEKINALGSRVDRVLEALGHPEALVTDLSTVNDFIEDDYDLEVVSIELGIRVDASDYIWELAEQLEE